MLATFVVTSLDDAGEGTLRQQVNRANASAGFDEIFFDSLLAGGSIQLASEILITETARIDATDLNAGITIDLNSADPTPAVNNGDGIRAFRSQATLYYGGTEFHGLTITGGDVADRGGAILGAQLIANSAFIDNAAADGGAVAIEHSSDDGPLDRTIRDSLFRENSASQNGGAIWTSIRGLARLDLEMLELTENTAGATGGGMYLFDEALTTTLSNSFFTNNVAATAGAIHSDTYSGNVHINECTVTGNSATEDDAGGILISTNYGSVLVEDCNVDGNVAARNGGGIVLSGSGGSIRNSLIVGNTAQEDGGGLSIQVSEQGASVFDSTIALNHADQHGGGVNVELNDAGAAIIRSTISDNSAEGNGGGIRHAGYYSPIDASEVSIRQSTVSGNSAAGDGGGLFGVNSITNSTLSGNIADGRGGGAFAYGSTLYFVTIVENIGDADFSNPGVETGGGLWSQNGLDGSTPSTISHSIIAGNLLGTAAPRDLDDLNGTGSVAANYSLIEVNEIAGLTGTGNLFDQDPSLGRLVDNGGTTLTHKPLADSPVIDRGDPLLDWDGEYDQRGEPYARFRDGNALADIAFDMGAVEVQGTNIPPIADAGPDQITKVAVSVTLDGTKSSDPDNGPTPLSYLWEVIEGPTFVGGFDNAMSGTPSFTTATIGDYVLQLTVSDGNQSDTDTMALTVVENSQPVARTDGSDLATILGVPGLFDGALSFDPDGDDIASYQWRIVNQPSGSTAELVGANTGSPSLDSDLAGIYDVELVVIDPSGNASQPAVTRLSVEAGPVSVGGPYVSEAGTDLQLTALTSEPLDQTTVFDWDFNGDGVFADAVGRSPLIEFSVWRDAIVAAGSSILPIGVMATATDGTTFVDYGTVSFRSGAPTSWHNAADPLDVDGDQVIAPIDALLAINELNDRLLTDANGVLPPPPSDELDLGTFTLLDAAPGFLDTNNDGIISPIDPLLVINELPSSSNLAGRQHDEIFADLDHPSFFVDLSAPIIGPSQLADGDEDDACIAPSASLWRC